MTNALMASRDRFAAAHPEERVTSGGRAWGVVEIAGDGPALLLIPGTLGRGDIFWQQMEALRGRVHLLSVSYPAHGGVVEWADDLVALLDERGIGSFSVLGSSLGGYLAQFIAATYPQRVEQLIAANTLRDAGPARQNPPYTSDLDAGPIEELRAGFGRGLNAWAQTHPDQQDMVELLLAEVGGRIPEPELRSRLKGIKNAPTLPPIRLGGDRIATIEGADDPLITVSMREEVRAALKPATAYRFESGGHFPYTIRPALYNAILEERLGLVPDGSTLWGSAGVRAL
jgi:maspardin